MTGLACLTLHQPYASLMALGVKHIETRSWPAPKSLIGQRIGIHAAKRPPKEFSLVGPYTAAKALGEWKLGRLNDQHADDWEPLPLGAIVATGVLADCVPMVSEGACFETGKRQGRDPFIAVSRTGEYVTWLSWFNTISAGHYIDKERTEWLHDQLPYGDFRPGRWAWLYEDVKPTTERCPACWGDGDDHHPEIPVNPIICAGMVCPVCNGLDGPCPTCKGAGRCEPVPAKGRQGIWRWVA